MIIAVTAFIRRGIFEVQMEKELREDEEWLAGRDHLTGLYSLHRFAEKAHDALVAMTPQAAENTVIVFLNLHRFQRYNRRYGYEEGDRVLYRLAASMQANSGILLCGRVAEDHFLFLTDKASVEEILRGLNHRLQEISYDSLLCIRAGIYDISPADSVIAAGDKAKAAADSLRGKSVGEVFWHYYDQELALAMERRAYILENFDRAIRNGWIHVYYQPVMRTLTGKLCGMEALARWEDPVYGLMPPALFIHVLEENLLIHKLDLHIVRLVCEDYRREVNAGHRFVPVSFNLSRLDFDLCDILDEINQIVLEHEVPKDMIHVEITESMLSDNDIHVRHTMELFHDDGYQVWMDDFGSGYSTLNVLKDYKFDEIKIDMRFLSDSGERSRKIITAVVDMAKKIGIQTLAEGVENESQLDFLREIGCEKIQGYYYGKPQLFDDGVRKLLETEEKVEEAALGRYYDQIGKVNLIDERCIALAEYDGERYRFPYLNERLRTLLEGLRIDSAFLLEEICNDPVFPAYGLLRRESEKLHLGTGKRSTSFVAEGRYFYLTGDCVGELPDRKMLLVFISDMADNKDYNREVELDEAIRSLYQTCENLYICNLEEKKCRSLLSVSENPEEDENWKHDIDPKGFAKDRIYPEDRDRYLEYANPDTLYSRMQNSPRGFVSSYFRTKGQDGQYHWMRHLFVLISKLGRKDYVGIAQTVEEPQLLQNAKIICESEQMETERMLDGTDVTLQKDCWRNLLYGSGLKICWKDVNRRYVGASRAFLDYFGLSSISEIRSMQDEEQKWNISGEEYRELEERILKEGIAVKLQPQKCMVHGAVRDVLTNKQPIYRNGKIVGILCYFFDVSDAKENKDPARESMDTITGGLNIRGLMLASERFQKTYEDKKKDFCYFYVDIHGYMEFREKNGKEVGEKLLRRISERMRTAAGKGSVIGRIWEDHYVVICPLEEQGVTENEVAGRIHQELKRIHRVGDIPVTVYCSIGSGRYSEAGSLEKCVLLAKERMLEGEKSHA